MSIDNEQSDLIAQRQSDELDQAAWDHNRYAHAQDFECVCGEYLCDGFCMENDDAYDEWKDTPADEYDDIADLDGFYDCEW